MRQTEQEVFNYHLSYLYRLPPFRSTGMPVARSIDRWREVRFGAACLLLGFLLVAIAMLLRQYH